MKPWQEKSIDFKHTANIRQEFGLNVGLYDPNKKTIYVDCNLPKTCEGTYRSILEHERFHAKLDLAGIKLKLGAEERLCFMLALAVTPEKNLTHTERMLKAIVYNPWRWTRKKDRTRIIEKACSWAGLDFTPNLKALAE